MARRYDTNDATDRATGLREAASAVRRGELVVLPDRHGLRHRRRRVHRGGRRRPAGGQGPRPQHAHPRPHRLPEHPARPRHRLLRAGLGAGRRLLAGRADPRRQAPAVPAVGPRRHPRHGRRADAAAPGRHRAADRGRPDGGLLRQPHRPPGAARTATPRRRCSATPSPSTSTAVPPPAPCRPRSSTSPARCRVLLRAGAISADELRKVVPDLEVAN